MEGTEEISLAYGKLPAFAQSVVVSFYLAPTLLLADFRAGIGQAVQGRRLP